jgi:hypothetical protein
MDFRKEISRTDSGLRSVSGSLGGPGDNNLWAPLRKKVTDLFVFYNCLGLEL